MLQNNMIEHQQFCQPDNEHKHTTKQMATSVNQSFCYDCHKRQEANNLISRNLLADSLHIKNSVVNCNYHHCMYNRCVPRKFNVSRRSTGYGFFVIGCGYFLSTELTSSEGYLFTPTPISCEDVSDSYFLLH